MKKKIEELLARYKVSERATMRRFLRSNSRGDRDAAIRAQAKVEILKEILGEEEDE